MKQFSRGDISVYIALTVGMLMLGSAVLLGLILARQIFLTRDLVSSERAFFAANAGQEEAFYGVALLHQPDVDPPVSITNTIEYESIDGVKELAGYEATVGLHGGAACGHAEGTFPHPDGAKRRLAVGSSGC